MLMQRQLKRWKEKCQKAEQDFENSKAENQKLTSTNQEMAVSCKSSRFMLKRLLTRMSMTFIEYIKGSSFLLTTYLNVFIFSVPCNWSSFG